MNAALPDGLLDALCKAVPGDGSVLTGEDAIERSQSDWSRMGTPLAVVRPTCAEEVSKALKACRAAGIAVTPWGGKTGLVHGGHADGQVAISLDRMNAIEDIDPVGGTMTVQAGCILQTAVEAAEKHDLLLPIDLGARGSAMVGGVLSTNAGGNRVIRYGMAREHVLGLEAVLADGTILSSMNNLIKNNAGYDLKQLFIGSEGTLGIITRAVFRLQPLPASQSIAILGVSDFAKLPPLLRHMERRLAGTMSAFEVMWSEFYDLVTTEPAKARPPLQTRHPYYVLVEAQGEDQQGDAERFEAVLAEAFEQDLVSDAVIAKSQAECAALWEMRDDVGQTSRNWPIYTYDVSLPIADMEDYVREVREGVAAKWPDVGTLTVFGHIGDGNLHLVAGVDARNKQTKKALDTIIYGGIAKRGGSVSAEHGIGLEKRDYLSWSRNEDEIALMKLLKHALDPDGLLNPGKLLADVGTPMANTD